MTRVLLDQLRRERVPLVLLVLQQIADQRCSEVKQTNMLVISYQLRGYKKSCYASLGVSTRARKSFAVKMFSEFVFKLRQLTVAAYKGRGPVKAPDGTRVLG